MAEEIFLQHWIFTRFGLPFLLVFFIVFAILEKTKLLGEKKPQINAVVAFVIGLVFVGVAYPTTVVNNMILFLTVAIIVVFIVLLLWSFLGGGEVKIPEGKGFRIILFIILLIIVLVALIWATGWSENVSAFFSGQNWTGNNLLWGNILFIIIIAVALAVVLGKKKSD